MASSFFYLLFTLKKTNEKFRKIQRTRTEKYYKEGEGVTTGERKKQQIRENIKSEEMGK